MPSKTFPPLAAHLGIGWVRLRLDTYGLWLTVSIGTNPRDLRKMSAMGANEQDYCVTDALALPQ